MRRAEESLDDTPFYVLSFFTDWSRSITDPTVINVKEDELMKSGLSWSQRSIQINTKSNIKSEKNLKSKYNMNDELVRKILLLFRRILSIENDHVDERTKLKAIEGFRFICANFDLIEDKEEMAGNAFSFIGNEFCPVYYIAILSSLVSSEEKQNAKLKKKTTGFVVNKLVNKSYLDSLYKFLRNNIERLRTKRKSRLFHHFYSLLLSLLTEAERKKKTVDKEQLVAVIKFSILSPSNNLRETTTSFLKKWKENKGTPRIFPACFELPKNFRNNFVINASYINSFIETFISENEKCKNLVTEHQKFSTRIFNITNSFSKFKGINELWKLVSFADGDDAFRSISDFMTQLYKSFTIDTSKSQLKSFGSHFIKYLIISLREEHQLANKEAVNRYLKLAIKVLKSLEGVRFTSDQANMKINVNVIFQKKNMAISTKSNATLLEIETQLRKKTSFKKRLQPIVMGKKATFYSAIEQITAYQLNYSQKNGGQHIIMLPINKFVDLEQYKSIIFSSFSKDKSFNDTVEGLILDENNGIYKDNLKTILSMLPPHEHFHKYFKSRFDEEGSIKSILKEEEGFAFDVYSTQLLNALTTEHGNKKKPITKMLIHNYFDKFLDYFFNTTEQPPTTETLEKQLVIIRIIVVMVGYEERPELSQKTADDYHSALIDILGELNHKKTKNRRKDVETVMKNLFMLYYLDTQNIETILKKMRDIRGRLSNISSDIVFGLIETIKVFPANKIYVKDVDDLFTKSQNSYGEFILVNIKLLLKVYKTHSSLTDPEESLFQMFKVLLRLKKPDFPSDFIDLTLQFMNEGFAYSPLFYEDLADEIRLWLDFYFFQTKQDSTNYDKYYNLITTQDRVTNLFNFIGSYTSYNLENAKNINEILSTFIGYQKHRGASENEWSLNPAIDYHDQENEFRGLTNLGMTCYVNSAVQQLFMIEDFLSFIISQEDVRRGSLLDKVS